MDRLDRLEGPNRMRTLFKIYLNCIQLLGIAGLSGHLFFFCYFDLYSQATTCDSFSGLQRQALKISGCVNCVKVKILLPKKGGLVLKAHLELGDL